MPTILTTPPRRRSRGWAALLFVPALLMGVANNASSSSGESGTITGECWSDPGADPQTGTCDPSPSYAVTAEDVTASAIPLAPVLRGSPKVAPVPADATDLRVEVVSTADPSVTRGDAAKSPLRTQVDTTAWGNPIESSEHTPHALDLHLNVRPPDLQVLVTVTSGSGTVQCRIYAGSTLVAIDTSTATATCSPVL